MTQLHQRLADAFRRHTDPRKLTDQPLSIDQTIRIGATGGETEDSNSQGANAVNGYQPQYGVEDQVDLDNKLSLSQPDYVGDRNLEESDLLNDLESSTTEKLLNPSTAMNRVVVGSERSPPNGVAEGDESLESRGENEKENILIEVENSELDEPSILDKSVLIEETEKYHPKDNNFGLEEQNQREMSDNNSPHTSSSDSEKLLHASKESKKSRRSRSKKLQNKTIDSTATRPKVQVLFASNMCESWRF